MYIPWNMYTKSHPEMWRPCENEAKVPPKLANVGTTEKCIQCATQTCTTCKQNARKSPLDMQRPRKNACKVPPRHLDAMWKWIKSTTRTCGQHVQIHKKCDPDIRFPPKAACKATHACGCRVNKGIKWNRDLQRLQTKDIDNAYDSLIVGDHLQQNVQICLSNNFWK